MAELGVGVEADSEAIGVVLAAVLNQEDYVSLLCQSIEQRGPAVW